MGAACGPGNSILIDPILSGASANASYQMRLNGVVCPSQTARVGAGIRRRFAAGASRSELCQRTLSAGSGVCFFVDLTQTGGADVRVDLGGGQAFVSEQFLDASDIRSPVEQVGGEGVPERVRAGSCIQLGDGQVFFEHPAHAAGGQDVAESVDEHGSLSAERLGFGAPFAFRGVRLDCFERERAERADAFLASFSAHSDDLFMRIDITILQSDQFAYPQAGRVHRFQDGPVAESVDAIGRGSEQQTSDLFIAEHVRQFPLATWVA